MENGLGGPDILGEVIEANRNRLILKDVYQDCNLITI